ncbi:MAG: hypothetical protein Kow0099_08300 [Candidatus Abyssubacteria bacterium]
MGKASVAVLLCLLLGLVAALPVMAQPCPDPGSGAEGVEAFKEAIVDCPQGEPAITCNGEFSIELTNFERDLIMNQVTFAYEIYNLGDPPDENTLNYWILDLAQLEGCLGAGYLLEDLVAACSIYTPSAGEDCMFVDFDLATQLSGVLFSAGLAAGEKQSFTVTLQEDLLAPGTEIEIGCVVAATQADEQDIRFFDAPVPGFVAVLGPVCEEAEVFLCPRSFGFWKNHLEFWPVDMLTLGDETYTQAELVALAKTPVRGDASLILARQLVPAKLNILAGADPAPIQDTIDEADALLATFDGKLPYFVRPNTTDGHEMTQLAETLAMYNEGFLTPDCVKIRQ